MCICTPPVSEISVVAHVMPLAAGGILQLVGGCLSAPYSIAAAAAVVPLGVMFAGAAGVHCSVIGPSLAPPLLLLLGEATVAAAAVFC